MLIERERKYVGFNNSIESTLENTEINIPAGKKGFTKIIVHRPVISKNTNVPVSDDKGYSTNSALMDGFFHSTTYYYQPINGHWRNVSYNTYDFSEKGK